MITLPSGRKIGPGEKPFIVAEIGSNWKTIEDCQFAVRAAQACGADAVKFQAFNTEALYGFSPKDAATVRYAAVQYGTCGDGTEMPGALPLEWLPRLKAEADKAGIEFMCSAFSPELIHAVNPFVNIHKVASAECTHVRMLERLADLGKPVFLSVGAHGGADMAAAMSILDFGKVPHVLLYCVAAYPAREVDLGVLPLLADSFRVAVGYSDHSTDVRHIPALAVEKGACVIEKHVTFLETLSTPDGPHSLTGPEFSLMVDCIRGRAPESRIGYVASECEMIARHNRRLIATKDIQEGDSILEGYNLGIYRMLSDDCHAFSPFMINEVDGSVARRFISAGSGIGPGDV
jgi:N-acetylneuraminate synthase